MLEGIVLFKNALKKRLFYYAIYVTYIESKKFDKKDNQKQERG